MNVYFLATGKSSLRDGISKHQKKYEKIIKNKKTLDMLSVRVVNLGIPRSGKTTFWHRMMDPSAKMKNDEPSTGLVEEQKPVVIKDVKAGTRIVTQSEWLTLDTKGDYARMLLDMFSQVDDSQVDDSRSLSEGSASDAPSEAYASTPSVAAADPQADPSTSPLFQKSFTNFFSKVLESDSDWEAVKAKLEDMILLNTADTGGHAEFLDMHAALINGPSIYLLFSRLTDELDKLHKIYYTDENSTSTKKEDSDCTVGEVFFQALSSITCFGSAHCAGNSSSGGGVSAKLRKAVELRESKVMFAGTFGDMVTDDEFKEKDAKLHQQIMDTAFYKNVMFADNDQLMLKVDNKSGGTDEIKIIRKIFESKIRKFFERIPIPASWFVLSLRIRDHQSPTMTLPECEVLASEINISPEELQTALWFLHHCLGDILYYPVGELHCVVFCKIQDIYKSVTKLIKKTYTAENAQHEAIATSNVFRNLGIFSLKEIEKTPEEKNSLSRDLLVRLLKHLNIITCAPSTLIPLLPFQIEDPYLMPCMLRNCRKNVVLPLEGNPEPLLLHFNCGFTPMGIFTALINRVFSQVHELQWKILTEVVGEENKIFKNRVKFRVGRDVVYLMSHLCYLEITILQQPPSPMLPVKLCRTVRKVFEDALQEVTLIMKYDFLDGHDYAFWCTECHEEKKHLAIVKEATSTTSAFMECRRDKGVTGDLNPRQAVWFSGKLWLHYYLIQYFLG